MKNVNGTMSSLCPDDIVQPAITSDAESHFASKFLIFDVANVKECLIHAI